MLTSLKVLTYYNPTNPLILSGEASSYGVGAALSHWLGEGEHLSFCLTLLSPAEKN